jgi:diketogulonate reductase-like aldo/keto reductase
MLDDSLANGDCLPLLGLGTWKAAPGEVGAADEVCREELWITLTDLGLA